MIRALIVDDEPHSREVLKKLITIYCPEIIIAGEADSVETALLHIAGELPDLVFLDVQMPAASGFELLKKFDPVPFDVIFVTCFDEYAINAIKFSALDYLLKPVEIELLKSAAEKARRNHDERTRNNMLVANLLQSVDPGIAEKKIAVHDKDLVRLIRVSDIVYIEGAVNYSTIHTIGGNKFTLPKTLKEFEDYSTFTDQFVRIHKSVIINTHHVEHYSKGSPFIIQMTNGSCFEASRRKKAEVLERLKG